MDSCSFALTAWKVRSNGQERAAYLHVRLDVGHVALLVKRSGGHTETVDDIVDWIRLGRTEGRARIPVIMPVNGYVTGERKGIRKWIDKNTVFQCLVRVDALGTGVCANVDVGALLDVDHLAVDLIGDIWYIANTNVAIERSQWIYG